MDVLNVNFGVARDDLGDMHWIYFPGREFVFYRCGFPVAFTKEAAPAGCSSIYVEVSIRPGERRDEEDLASSCFEGLVRCGILRRDDRIVARRIFRISPAYVVYDRHRREHLGPALGSLAALGIRSVGRYGGWQYSSMEDSLAEGREVAEAIRGTI